MKKEKDKKRTREFKIGEFFEKNTEKTKKKERWNANPSTMSTTLFALLKRR